MSENSQFILLFILISLFLGGLTREFNKLTNFPYTPMLLVIGIIWGASIDFLGDFGESARAVANIDPHMILLIFIPALVFESSSSTDWHTFKREFGQVLILALPGVLLTAVLASVSIRYILNYSEDFDWATALTLGAILAATDPVAVVALLKEVGASKRLATMIEGESLLNDGTAMVMFTVTLEMAMGEEIGLLDILWSFVRMSIGGPLIGLLGGMIMAIWIKRIYNDSVLERSITFFVVYSVFYISEGTELKVSGVLALVAFGLYMSAWGKVTIDVNSEDVVHNFWSMIGYIAETLIFLLSGIIIGEKVITEDVQLMDWMNLIILFILLTLIRTLVVLISYPILSKYGYGFDWRQSVILVHGGLRGAVGLSLALIVHGEDEEDIEQRVRNLTLFHTAGIATLTLLINATTTGLLIKKLGLAKMSISEMNLIRHVVGAIHEVTVESINELKNDEFLRLADWARVKELTGIKKMLTDLASEFNEIQPEEGRIKKEKTWEMIKNHFEESMYGNEEELIVELRHRFLCTLKGTYWHEYEKGQCSPQTALRLIESADTCLDYHEEPMDDWPYLEKALLWRPEVYCFLKFKNLPLIGRIFNLLLYNNLVFAYDVAATFILTHMHAIETMNEVLGNEPDNESVEEILKEANSQMANCKSFISCNISDVFAEINRDIETKKAAYFIINEQLVTLKEFHTNGFIDEKEFSNLYSRISKQLYKLNRLSLHSEMPSLETIIKEIEFFEFLNEEELSLIIDNAKTLTYYTGETLSSTGEAVSGVYILLRGKIHEFNENFEYFHNPGSIVGIEHLLRHIYTNLTTCKAESIAYIAFIKKEYLPNYECYTEVEQKLWQLAAPVLIKLYPAPFLSILNTVEYEKLKQLLRLSTLGKYLPGEEIDVKTGAILVKGVITKLEDPPNTIPLDLSPMKKITKKLSPIKNRDSKKLAIDKTEALALIEPDSTSIYYSGAETSAVVLHFCPELYEAQKSKNLTFRKALDSVVLRRRTEFLETVQGRDRLKTQMNPNLLNPVDPVVSMRRPSLQSLFVSRNFNNLDRNNKSYSRNQDSMNYKSDAMISEEIKESDSSSLSSSSNFDSSQDEISEEKSLKSVYSSKKSF